MAGSEFKPYTSKGVKAFSCPNCGGQVEVRAPGQSLTAVCSFCRAVIDPNDANHRVIQTARDKKKREPKVPLGHRGKIDGKIWECVGFMVRRNLKYNHDWEEYLLFNPVHGFRFLIYDSGHWTLSKSTLRPAKRGRNRSYVSMHGEHFKRFVAGKARVMYVEGEFFWEVKRGDEVQTVDYVKPPYMLSVEHSGNEEHWSLGEYMKPAAIKNAFGKEAKIGWKSGVGANQPNPAGPRLKQILPIWGILLAALTVLQFGFLGTSSNKVVFEKQGTLSKGIDSLSTDTLMIDGNISNLEVFLNSNVSNMWVEMEGVLTATQGERQYGFVVDNSYYSGVSGGESWSEGSRRKTRVMNNVVPGKYVMKVVAYTGILKSRPAIQYTLRVKRDVPIWSNYFFFITILSLPVIILFIWQSSFESQRWES